MSPMLCVNERATESGTEVLADALKKMGEAVSRLEEQGVAEDEVCALRRQLKRLEGADDSDLPCVEQDNAVTAHSGDTRKTARELVAMIPLDEICRDGELMEAFLSEMFLAVADAAAKRKRRQRTAEAVEAAKARGVRFGRERIPVPDGFEELRRAWRSGEITAEEAGRRCGFSRDTFLRMVRRSEQEGDGESRTGRAGSARAADKRGDTVRHNKDSSLSYAGADGAF